MKLFFRILLKAWQKSEQMRIYKVPCKIIAGYF